MPLELQRSFRLYVTHVEGVGSLLKICGQLDQPCSLMIESLFETARDNLEKGVGCIPPGAIQNGKICAAKYKDGAYYRAKIISTANLASGLVGVYFIDYGNRDIIPVNAVRLLDSYDPMFQRLPGQANEFYLARVMNPSGRWEDSVLQMMQNLLCYAEYTASVESLTYTPIISIQFMDSDFSSHLISNRLGVAIPVPKQRMMLAQTEGENMQACNWQQNKVESPTYTELAPHSVNQNLPSNPASAMFLQRHPPVPSLVSAPMAINQGMVANKSDRDLTNVRAIQPLQVVPNRPLLEPNRMESLPSNKSTTYKSRLLECNSQHKVFISFIEDGPELFAVQPLENFKQFQNMMDNINSRAHTRLTELPMIGSVCLGRISEDRIICRAIVTNLSGSQCKLYFVDLGDTELVSYYDIFEIPEEFMKLHVFAMRFCLSGVKNLPKGPYLNEAFKKLVSGKLLTLRVVAAEGPPLIQYGELYLDNKNVLELLAANMKEKLHFKWVDMLQSGGRYSVLVSYVDSCLKFYVQFTDQNHHLNAVMEAVKAHCESTLPPGELPVGAACCARFADDGKWYRACVRSTDHSKVVVAYVDYGNEQEVAVTDLRTITPDLIKLPAQAMKCALKGFESTFLDAKSSNLLEELALEKNLTANVVGVLSSDTKLITLTDDSISPPLDVAREIQRLIEMPPVVAAPAPAPVACGPEGGAPGGRRMFGWDFTGRCRNQPEPSPAAAENWRLRATENNNGVDRFGTARQGVVFQNRSDCRQSDRENKSPFERIARYSDKFQDRPDNKQNDRENKYPFERVKAGRHMDTVQDRPDHRQSDRRGSRPWEPAAPIKDWRESLAPQPPTRESHNKLHKQDDKEEMLPEERHSGSRASRGEKGERRAERRDDVADKMEVPKRECRERSDRGDRAQQRSAVNPRARADRSFGSDCSGGSSRERRSPHKPRGASTPAPPRQLTAPAPLDTPYAEPTVEPGAEHEVAVTWIASPHSFYTQILALQPKFLEMMHRIPELYKGVRPYAGDVAAGASVLARYPADGVLYRATVVAAQPLSKFVVQYVDFGNKQLVDAKDIWQLERELTELPKMAVHCSLLGVAPPEGGWRAGPELDQCFSAPRYQCVFAERAPDAQRVSLWSNGASVADALVDRALAARADQPPPVALKDEAVDLTVIVGQQIPCRVTHVHSFDKFYVQLDLEKAALVEEAVASLDAALLTPLAADSLADGVHCTLRHEGRVFRAILSDTADAARVAAVLPDYGRTITTSLDQVMILPTELGVYYYQSLECCLNNYSAESRRLLAEDVLKARLTDNKFIVYIDDVEGISLVTTLYDIATGQKLALFEPDEGAIDEVTPLCPRTVLSYNFGLASVQHLESLNEIHLQRAADLGRVQALLDSLFTFYEEGAPEPLAEFAADTLCAAKSADENWYRAVIVSASDDAATVQFPDYGNKETVPKSQLKKLDPRFYEPCALALEVALGLDALQESALARLAEWTVEREVQVTLASGADGWLASLHLDGADLSMRLVDEQLAAPRAAAAAEPAESTAPAAPAEAEGAAAAPPPAGCVQAYISHIDTPGHFWLQLAERVPRIHEVQAALQAGAAAYPDLARRELDTLCAAKYSADELWYRAQVLDLDADITTVRFVDYGNTDVLDNQPGVIKELPDALAALEPLALRSSVNAVPTGTGQWSEAASDSFAELAGDTEAPVDALVVLKDETTYVDLFVGGQNVTDRLVALGHAARAEQPECGDLPVCFASHVNSPSEFWIQLESAAVELQAMEAAMVDAEHFPELPSREEGILCAAKHPEDEAWYRAQVIVDGSEGTEVLFIDYGNASITSELRSLPPGLMGKPALSSKCALQKPPDVNEWSRLSEEKLNELSAEGATTFKVKFITAGDISIVELYLEGRSVTEQLVGLCEQRPPAERPAPDGSESVLAVDSDNEAPSSMVKMHKEEDEFEDANEVSSSKLEQSFDSSDTVIVIKYFESDPEISDIADKVGKALEKDTSSETLQNSNDFIKTPEQSMEELLVEVSLLSAIDAATLDQCVPGDETTYIDCEPENAAAVATVKVNFTTTPKTIGQSTEDTVHSKICDMEDLKNTVVTDNSSGHEIVLNDMKTDAPMETVASNITTGDSDDVKSVFCASKPENVKESTDFTTASVEATNDNAESIVPFEVIKETEAKETVTETIDSIGSKILPDEINLTTKLDSNKVSEFNEKINGTDKNTTVVTTILTDSEERATPISNSGDTSPVFCALKQIESENLSFSDSNELTSELNNLLGETDKPIEMASTSKIVTAKQIDSDSPSGDETLATNQDSISKVSETEKNHLTEIENCIVMFETPSQDEVNTVSSLNSEIEETQKITETILEEIDTINKSESEAPKSDTGDPTETVERDCVTVQDIFSTKSGESVRSIEPVDALRDDQKLNLSYSKSDESLESIHTVIEDNTVELYSDTLNSPDDKTNQLVSPKKDMSSVTLVKTNDTITTRERDESKDSINTDSGHISSGDASLSQDNSLVRDSCEATEKSSEGPSTTLITSNTSESETKTEKQVLINKENKTDSGVTNIY